MYYWQFAFLVIVVVRCFIVSTHATNNVKRGSYQHGGYEINQRIRPAGKLTHSWNQNRPVLRHRRYTEQTRSSVLPKSISSLNDHDSDQVVISYSSLVDLQTSRPNSSHSKLKNTEENFKNNDALKPSYNNEKSNHLITLSKNPGLFHSNKLQQDNNYGLIRSSEKVTEKVFFVTQATTTESTLNHDFSGNVQKKYSYSIRSTTSKGQAFSNQISGSQNLAPSKIKSEFQKPTSDIDYAVRPIQVVENKDGQTHTLAIFKGSGQVDSSQLKPNIATHGVKDTYWSPQNFLQTQAIFKQPPSTNFHIQSNPENNGGSSGFNIPPAPSHTVATVKDPTAEILQNLSVAILQNLPGFKDQLQMSVLKDSPTHTMVIFKQVPQSSTLVKPSKPQTLPADYFLPNEDTHEGEVVLQSPLGDYETLHGGTFQGLQGTGMDNFTTIPGAQNGSQLLQLDLNPFVPPDTQLPGQSLGIFQGTGGQQLVVPHLDLNPLVPPDTYFPDQSEEQTSISAGSGYPRPTTGGYIYTSPTTTTGVVKYPYTYGHGGYTYPKPTTTTTSTSTTVGYPYTYGPYGYGPSQTLSTIYITTGSTLENKGVVNTTVPVIPIKDKMKEFFTRYYIGYKLWYLPLLYAIYHAIIIIFYHLMILARHYLELPTQLHDAAVSYAQETDNNL